MKSVAVYSLKGGVGKTTLATALAIAAALRSARRTLLWDLDAQAAATFLLGGETGAARAEAVFAKELNPAKIIRRTPIERLDLLPADMSLRGLDRLFEDLDRKKRLTRLIEGLGDDYDRIILDAPPGITETSAQILRAADLIVVPVVPSPLARRAFDEVVSHLARQRLKHGAIMPVFNMVDRRRALHREALATEPDWPVVPMASLFERVTAEPATLPSLAGRSGPAAAVAALWVAVERRLAG